jgi:hypothetical protein
MNYEITKRLTLGRELRIIFFCFSLFTLVACGGPQTTKTVGGTVFDISSEIIASRGDTLIDIGKIRAGEVVRYDARLRNIGDEPLAITKVGTSCGCTSVEYDKEPVAPGGTANFSFSFDSRGFWGMQLKLIEIYTSAADHPYRLQVRSEIEESGQL